MNWTEILLPVVVEHLAPLVLTVAGGAVAIVVTQVGGIAKTRLNVDIDAQLNAMLHAAIERSVTALLGGGKIRPENIAEQVVRQLHASNPDALKRFGLDADPLLLRKLVQAHLDPRLGRLAAFDTALGRPSVGMAAREDPSRPPPRNSA